MDRLAGKIALVTGAGGGIGRAICTRFAANGAAVACVDLDADTVRETAASVERAGGRAWALVADVADESAAVEAVAGTADAFGGINVLINNAVHDLPVKPLTETSLAEWRRTTDVNLTAAFLFSKHAIPVMAAGGGGSIIHVASQLGRVARPGRPWYCAQKSALISLARAMALDHAEQSIRVNSLSPGPIETERYIAKFDSVEAARASSHTLLDRLGQPDEIAHGAVFLASDESSFMTGSDLLIDGGYTAI